MKRLLLTFTLLTLFSPEFVVMFLPEMPYHLLILRMMKSSKPIICLQFLSILLLKLERWLVSKWKGVRRPLFLK